MAERTLASPASRRPAGPGAALALGLLAALTLAPPARAEGRDMLDDFELFLRSDPSPFEVVDVPGVGEVPGNTSLKKDFELPDGLTYGDPPQDTVAAGTLIVEFPVEAVEALTDDTQLEPILTSLLLPPAEVDADPTYDIKVLGVDTRNFPEVTVEFNILPKDITAPSFSPSALTASSFHLMETVLGSNRVVTDYVNDPPVELCETASMVVGIAIDTSCSVQSVITELKDAALLFAREILDPARARSPDDAVALYAFDGRGKSRAPTLANATDGDPSTPAYYSINNQSASAYAEFEAVNVDRPCLGSPIFESMIEEIGWLTEYEPDKDLRRVLVSFADFRDTEGKSAKNEMIQALIANSQIDVVGLGFGRVHKDKVREVFDIDPSTGEVRRGGFIQDGAADTLKALKAVYDGLGYKYCLTYVTPFPNRFNEVVDLQIQLTDPGTGAVSKTTARYALPLVVPEDTRDVRVFLPLTYTQYESATTGDPTKVEVRVTPRFVPDPDLPPGRGPERTTPGTLVATRSAVVDDPDLGYGLWLRPAELGAGWRRLFAVPTQFVRVDPDDAGAPRLLDVSRFELEVTIKSEASLGDGSPYKGTPILTVQDRTPPHLFVRLSPATGQAPSELRIREDAFDRDPMPLDAAHTPPANGRLDSTSVLPEGAGRKQARVRLAWVDTEGKAFTADLEGQRWSRRETVDGEDTQVAALEDAPDTDEERRVFTPPDYAEGGLRVDAGVRVQIQVLARDNFGGLEQVDSSHPLESKAFVAPDEGHPDGPIHARFDLNRPEAQGSEPTPPFLPLVPVAEMRADPLLPGVSWWIESADDRDRFDQLEGLPSFQYPKEDELVLFDLAKGGVVDPPFPLRTLEVHAQDGQGNVTRVTLPIFIQPAGFQARKLDSQTRRVGGRD